MGTLSQTELTQIEKRSGVRCDNQRVSLIRPWLHPINAGMALVPPEGRPTFRERLAPFAECDDRTLQMYARELLAQLDELAGAA